MLLQPGKDLFAGCARFAGGGLGGPLWLDCVHREQKLVPTVVSLKRGLQKSLEVLCHKDCEGVPVAIAAAAANAAGVPCGWIVRKKWKEMLPPQCHVARDCTRTSTDVLGFQVSKDRIRHRLRRLQKIPSSQSKSNRDRGDLRALPLGLLGPRLCLRSTSSWQ